MLEASMQKKIVQKMMKTYSQPKVDQFHCLEIMEFGNPQSMRDQLGRSEELSGDLRGRSDKSQPIDEMMTEKPATMLVDRRELDLSSSRRTESQTVRAERRIIPNTGQEKTYDLGCVESRGDDYRNINGESEPM